MAKTTLIVQAVSFGYVQNVVRFVHRMLRAHLDPDAELILCDELDHAVYEPGSTVFVIGENFARHTRRAGCRYVYLNFSIVEMMGNPLKTSRQGWKAIRRKRAMLMEKLDLYDVLLDYFAPQTRQLRRKVAQPVEGFGVAVHPRDMPAFESIGDRIYDVCFVGGISPRRREVLDQIKALGLTLSPHEGVVFEEIAARSRCCLNMHAQRSNHLETPRIVGAMAVGCPVVSEQSFGLSDLLPPDHLVTAPRLSLADAAARLVADRVRLEDLSQRSCNWFGQNYLPACEQDWARLCQRLRSLTRPARTCVADPG